MRKKSIPFHKFTKSFPVFPFFSSIFFIYFTKKPQYLYRCGSHICKDRLLMPDMVDIIYRFRRMLAHTYREPISHHSSKTVSSSQCSK